MKAGANPERFRDRSAFTFGNEMKSIYRAIFLFCTFLLILGFIVCFAIPPDESFASQLERNPDIWQIHIEPSHQAWVGRDDNGAKELLLTFLHNNHVPTDKKLGYTAIGLVIIAIFSGIGFLRERYYEKKLGAEPIASANRSPAADGGS